MPTRIKGLDGSSIGASGAGSPIEQIRSNNAVSTSTAEPHTQQPDSVHITESARTLSTLSQAVQASPEIDTQRVADLQTALANGSYSIDAGNIADRLMQFDRDLGAAS